MTTIDDAYRLAFGPDAEPFEFQRHIAETGLPEVLNVPTGCGKTPAVVLGWLYRKMLHPVAEVRASTPTRLVIALPLRTLTHQTASLCHNWVERLGLAGHVDVHTLMGGAPISDQRWRLNPARPAIIVCTLDMGLSRALNRGYRASRAAWPIDFALFNDDCHWVFDEVQLMGTALFTSRQLYAFRSSFGVPTRHGSTWMSATLDDNALRTVDAGDIVSILRLSDTDRNHDELRMRLTAPKTLACRRVIDPKDFVNELVDAIAAEHRTDTTTLVVVNTVADAQALAKKLRKGAAPADADVTLLHSRFRPADRHNALDSVLNRGGESTGRVVVSTQVIEAGVDISADTLITEVAPWSSIVQRAGRCNRWGEAHGAGW